MERKSIFTICQLQAPKSRIPYTDPHEIAQAERRIPQRISQGMEKTKATIRDTKDVAGEASQVARTIVRLCKSGMFIIA